MYVDPGWYEAYWLDRQTARRRTASIAARVAIRSALIVAMVMLLRHFGSLGI